MPYPYDTATLDALTRLGTYYNGNDYNAGSNPGGMGAGGHRINFVPSLQDVSTVGDSISDAADAASTSAAAAAASATTASDQAAALSGTSTSSVTIGTGSKSFTTQSGKSFNVGSFMMIQSAANPTTHYMIGQVTAYSGTSLTVNVTETGAGTGTRSDWTILGRTGRTGATGSTGATGAQGETASLRWLFGSGTTDTDPGSGIVTFNNSTYASVTQLYFDNNDAFGASQTTFLDAFDDSTNTALRGTLTLMQIDDPDNYAVFNVTGAVVDGTGYRKVPVAFVMANNTFVAAHEIAVTFVRTGDKGTDGAGAGDVISDIASVTDGRIVVFNGTTGKHVTNASFGIGTSGANVGALSTANTWAGAQTFADVVVGGAFSLSGDITPSQITSNQNDYAPSGIAGACTLRLSTDASRNITGITTGSDGRRLDILNVGSFDIVLVNDATSTAANRFLLGADFTLAAGQGISLLYDSTTMRWVPSDPIGLAANGSISRPSYSFASDPDTGMYWIAANTLGFAAGGAEIARLTTAGLQVTAATASTALYLTGNTAPTIRFDPSSGDTVNARLYQSGDTLFFGDGTNVRASLGLTTGLLDLPYGQIKFPATQNASSDVNTLDDYEEGTFTPTLTFGGGNTGMTFSSQEGSYTKIGRCVLFYLRFVLSAKGSSTGVAVITGLPFVAAASPGYAPLSTYMGSFFLSSGDQTTWHAIVSGGSSTITLWENHNESLGAVSQFDDSYFLDNSDLMLGGVYFV